MDWALFVTYRSISTCNSVIYRYLYATPYFTGLEKNPLYDVKQFRPPPDIENNKLAENAENMLETVMHRLADRVRIRRIQVRLDMAFFQLLLSQNLSFNSNETI